MWYTLTVCGVGYFWNQGRINLLGTGLRWCLDFVVKIDRDIRENREKTQVEDKEQDKVPVPRCWCCLCCWWAWVCWTTLLVSSSELRCWESRGACTSCSLQVSKQSYTYNHDSMTLQLIFKVLKHFLSHLKKPNKQYYWILWSLKRG